MNTYINTLNYMDTNISIFRLVDEDVEFEVVKGFNTDKELVNNIKEFLNEFKIKSCDLYLPSNLIDKDDILNELVEGKDYKVKNIDEVESIKINLEKRMIELYNRKNNKNK